MAVLVYLLLIVVAANVGRRRPGWPYRAGACVAWRWRRRRLDAARARFPSPPMVVRAAPPLTPEWQGHGVEGVHELLGRHAGAGQRVGG